MNELVSVIVPIFNSEKNLEICINSIIRQSHKNIEIILIDDGSSDSSLDICRKLQIAEKRIMVFSQKNSGVSSARNEGLVLASGKWIMFVDSDDSIEENIIEKLLAYSSDDIDIVSCCAKVVLDTFEDNNYFFVYNRQFSGIGVKGKIPLFRQLMDSSYGQIGKAYTAIGVPWGKLYRTSLIQQHSLKFNVELKRAQDNLFNMYAFFYARSIFYLNSPLYIYRYEHMRNHHKKYNPQYKDLYCAVLKAREVGMESLGICIVPELYDASLYETARSLIGILKNSAFHFDNKINYSERLNIAIKICESPCFNKILRTKITEKILDRKYKILYILIYNKRFLIFYWLCRASMILELWPYIKRRK